MSWETITQNEVLEEFTPQEVASINAIQGATTNLAAILTRAVGEWRGVISINQTPGAAGTIPADVRPHVIASARWRWLIAMPALRALQTKERADAAKEAADLLKEIRGGQLVESSDSSVPVSQHASDVASANARRADAAKMDGLL